MPVRFPIDARNRKAIREQILLGNGVEAALTAAAQRAAGVGQEVFVHRGYTSAGRVSVWIVDRSSGNVRERSARLKQALARVTI